MPTIDGSIADWPANGRLDTPQTGAAGYGLYGTTDADYFYFAITSEAAPVGANTTLWIDTDLDRGTGYRIWGSTGGAEYNVEVGADGVPRLYSGGPGETYIADLGYGYSADGSVLEFGIARSDIGAPSRVRVLADVNNAAFIPNDYAAVNLFVGDAPAPIAVGGKTLDGDLGEWANDTLLSTVISGANGENTSTFRGDFDVGSYTFALSSTAAPVGAGTTIWLDTDREGSTGYQVWGWAVGAEYNIQLGGDGIARLYSSDTSTSDDGGGTFLSDVDFRRSADGGTVELALDPALVDGSSRVRVFADINNQVHLPSSYATGNLLVGALSAPVVAGGKTLDGDLGEWAAGTRLDTAATGAPGYALHGDLQGGVYTFAIATDGTTIGAGTTIWLDTDLDRSTGHLIWGISGGVEYNVDIGADGIARLYSGAAGATYVSEIDYALNAAGTMLELAIDASLIGGPAAVRVFADVNNATFLPNDYQAANLIVGEPAPIVIGSTTIDGTIGADEWLGSRLLYDSAPGTDPGYRLYGAVEEGTSAGDQFVLAIGSDIAAIGANTTIWIDADLNASTGYQIWGWAGGAEYNIDIAADGTAKLYSGAAGENSCRLSRLPSRRERIGLRGGAAASTSRRGSHRNQCACRHQRPDFPARRLCRSEPCGPAGAAAGELGGRPAAQDRHRLFRDHRCELLQRHELRPTLHVGAEPGDAGRHSVRPPVRGRPYRSGQSRQL